MKILIVLTSHDQLGNSGRKTGFWLEEFVAPYYLFKEVKAEITLASPKGGRPPLDPLSTQSEYQTDETRRFETDQESLAVLGQSVPLSTISADDYDAVFYPGGHGVMWDLAEDRQSIKLIQDFVQAQKPTALVCHASGALRHVKTADGRPLVEGRQVTGFSNSEEEGAGLSDVVPFLVEDMLKTNGGIYSSGDDWSSHVVQDGLLITGQNPESSKAVAQALLHTLSVQA